MYILSFVQKNVYFKSKYELKTWLKLNSMEIDLCELYQSSLSGSRFRLNCIHGS